MGGKKGSGRDQGKAGLDLRFILPAAILAVLLILVYSNAQKEVWNSWGYLKWGKVPLNELPFQAGLKNAIVVIAVLTAYSAAFIVVYYLLQGRSLRIREDLIAAGVYTLFAILATYPLIFYFTNHVPGDNVDANHLIWSIWFVKTSILQFKDPFHTDYICYPHGGDNLFNAIIPLLGAISAPIQAAFGVIFAYNTLCLLSIAWSGLGMYKLVEYLTEDRKGALACGLAFALIPYRMVRFVGQLNIASTQWMPFYILHLIKGLREGSRRDQVLAGAFLAATAWTEMTQVMFLVCFTVPIVANHIWGKRKIFRLRDLFDDLMVPAVAAFVFTSPLIYMIVTEYGSYPPMNNSTDLLIHSSDVLSYLTPPSYNPVLGGFTGAIEKEFTSFMAEKVSYVGFGILLLAGSAFIDFKTSRKKMLERGFDFRADKLVWAAAALLFFLLSLGPVLHFNGLGGYEEGGRITYVYGWLPLPYSAIESLPLVSVTRTPARFSIGVAFSLIVLAGYGLTKAARTNPWDERLLSVFCALLVLEFSAIPYPLSDMRYNQGYDQLKKYPGDVVFEIPDDGVLDYYQSVHEKKRVSGNFVRMPNDLARFIERRDADVRMMKVDEFARKYGVDYLIIQKDKLGNESYVLLDHLGTIFGKPAYDDVELAVYRTRITKG